MFECLEFQECLELLEKSSFYSIASEASYIYLPIKMFEFSRKKNHLFTQQLQFHPFLARKFKVGKLLVHKRESKMISILA